MASSIQWVGFPDFVGNFMLKYGHRLSRANEMEWVYFQKDLVSGIEVEVVSKTLKATLEIYNNFLAEYRNV